MGSERAARILLIEDERVVAEATAAALRSAGHESFGIAASAPEALALAERHRPDLAIVDIGLRGPMDGVAVAERLNALDIAIVYLSGHSEPALLDRAAQTQPYGYLLKPVSDRALGACVTVAVTRHRIERLHREHELWFSALMQCKEIAVLVTDEIGAVRFANRYASTVVGVTEWADTNVASVLEFPADSANPIDQAVSSGTSFPLPERCTVVQRDGSRRLIEGCVAPVNEAGSPASGVVVAFRELRELKTHVAEESLGTLANEIAHDVNNMLTMITYCAGLGQSSDEQQPSHTLFLDIQVCAERAAALLGELTGRGATETTSIAGSIERSIKRDIDIALRGSSVELTYLVDSDLWPGKIGDAERADILTNLVINARHAMRDHGRLRVEARNRLISPNEEIDLAPGRYVEILVSDSGAGMDATTMERAFDPYFTTKGSGSGLGLPSARRIAERCGGRLLAESTLGEGSTFILTLPASEETGHAPKLIEARRPTTGAGRALVVDDDEKVREVLAKLIRYQGWEVESVGNGRDAIARYSAAMSAGRRFDLAILDVRMTGDVGGIETFEELKAIDPSVQAVVSSGYPQHVLAELERLGFCASLPKPYNVDQLAAILQAHSGVGRDS